MKPHLSPVVRNAVAVAIAIGTLPLSGCSAVAGLFPQESASAAAESASAAAALVRSCTAVTAALGGVASDLTAAQNGIASASAAKDVSTFSADDLAQFSALADNADAVAKAVTPLTGTLESTDLTPEVANLANSMTFFESYFTQLSKRSSDLPSAATAESAAKTASDAASAITSLCADTPPGD